MNEQILFNYISIVAFIIGCSLVGWVVGKEGLIGLGKNKKINYILFLWIALLVWSVISKLNDAFNTTWIIVSSIIFIIFLLLSRATKPKSQKLFETAKQLHETTYVSNWHIKKSEKDLEGVRNNKRLLKAKSLYFEALSVQERLLAQSPIDESRLNYSFNIIAVYHQLCYLYRIWEYIDKAEEYCNKGLSLLEELVKIYIDLENNKKYLSLKSDLIFRLAEIRHFTGKYNEALSMYHESDVIDKIINNKEGLSVKEKLKSEIIEKIFPL